MAPLQHGRRPHYLSAGCSNAHYEAASMLPTATATPTDTPTNIRSLIDRYLPLIYR